jgi:hypothetical protein
MAPCRLGIMPDFFGDDLMIDAAKVAVERTEVPSENIFLYMVGSPSTGSGPSAFYCILITSPLLKPEPSRVCATENFSAT